MIHLQYKNERGIIHMSNRPTDVWRILSITGLGYPSREFSTISYYGVDGQQTVNTRLTSRSITVSGDIQNFGSMQHEVSRAIEILHFPGTLTVSAGGRRRRTLCRCASFENTDRNRVAEKFIIQLIADDPNFYDETLTKQNIFGERDLIEGSFTLPCVFTERINESVVVNRGYTNLEPVIKIYSKDAVTSVFSDQIGVEIKNITTNQMLKIEKETQNGEVITIDVKNRIVTSNMAGDITNLLSSDSFLDQFYFVPGPNEIITLSYNTGQNITAACEYYNTYLEAVY